MWIGIAVAVLISGTVQADAKLFKDEASCLAESAPMVKVAASDSEVLAYKVDCLDAEAVLIIKKSESVKPSAPKPSKEPGPTSQGS